MFDISFRNYLAHGDLTLEASLQNIDLWKTFFNELGTIYPDIKKDAANFEPNADIFFKNFKTGNKLQRSTNNQTSFNKDKKRKKSLNNNNNGKKLKIKEEKKSKKPFMSNKSSKMSPYQNDDFNEKKIDHQNTPLHVSLYGDTEQVKQLLAKGGAVVAKNKDGHYPIHLAAENGIEDVVKLLLQTEGHHLDNDNYGKTALDLAAAAGHPNTVKILCEKMEESRFSSALRCASLTDRLEIVKYSVIEKKVKPQDELLLLCSEKGSNNVLHYLLSVMPSSVNLDKAVRDTILHAAVHSGNTTTLVLLLNNIKKLGLNINSKNDDGNTPLHIAVKYGRKEMIKRFKVVNADVNNKNNNKSTPLHLAVLNKRVWMIQDLLEWNNIKVDEKDEGGLTPLHVAELLHLPEATEMLTKKLENDSKSVDLFKNNSNNQHNKRHIVKLVTEAVLSNKMSNKNTQIILKYACQYEDLDFNVISDDKMTAFNIKLIRDDLAAAYNFMGLIKKLLSTVGANENAVMDITAFSGRNEENGILLNGDSDLLSNSSLPFTSITCTITRRYGCDAKILKQ